MTKVFSLNNKALPMLTGKSRTFNETEALINTNQYSETKTMKVSIYKSST